MNKTVQSLSLKFSSICFRLSLLLFLSCIVLNQVSAKLPAGPVIVSAKADTTQIRIGEQFKIHLKANAPTDVKLNFPVFPDTLKGIEIVSRSPVDTVVSADKSNSTYTQTLQVTSFDSGYYVVEPFLFTSLNTSSGLTDTFATEAFLVEVKSVPVDTTRAIKDIKAPLDVPLTWQEIMVYAGAILLAVLLTIVLYRVLKRKKAPVIALPKTPARPAHELALEALKRTEEEKLWQQGFFKKYHSAVSDILREYIERSFDINALELTSDETLERIRRRKFDMAVIEKLSVVLRTADLVKFAKMTPLADENETSMKFAYDFINRTRPVTQQDVEGKEVSS